MAQQAFLNERQVCERTSLSRTTLWRLRRENDFPEPVRITERRVAYRAADIDAWISKRSEASARKLG